MRRDSEILDANGLGGENVEAHLHLNMAAAGCVRHFVRRGPCLEIVTRVRGDMAIFVQ